MISDDLVAVLAAVLLVVTSGYAEGNEAAAEPASEKGENEAENPCEGSLRLVTSGDTSFTAELAGDLLRLVAKDDHRLSHENLLRLCLHHYGLAASEWLLFHTVFSTAKILL